MSIEHGEFSHDFENDILKSYENYERQKYQPLLEINERLEEMVKETRSKALIPSLSNKLLDELIENNTDESGRDIICDLLCKLEIDVEDKEKLFDTLVQEERPLTDFEKQFVSEIADKDRHLLDRYFPEHVFDEPSAKFVIDEFDEDFENEEEAV